MLLIMLIYDMALRVFATQREGGGRIRLTRPAYGCANVPFLYYMYMYSRISWN